MCLLATQIKGITKGLLSKKLVQNCVSVVNFQQNSA